MRNYGTNKVINEQVDLIRKSLNISEETEHDSFLECGIHKDKEDNAVYMYQPQLIERLEKSFGNRVKNTKKPLTSGMPIQ